MATLNFFWRRAARQPHIRLTFRRDNRRRGGNGAHSMSAITTLAAGALAGMMMTQVKPAFIVPHAAAAVLGEARTTAKTSRLPRVSPFAPANRMSARRPRACTPSEITPARPGPIAYV